MESPRFYGPMPEHDEYEPERYWTLTITGTNGRRQTQYYSSREVAKAEADEWIKKAGIEKVTGKEVWV